jgi:hypothetical protein
MIFQHSVKMKTCPRHHGRDRFNNCGYDEREIEPSSKSKDQVQERADITDGEKFLLLSVPTGKSLVDFHTQPSSSRFQTAAVIILAGDPPEPV